MTPERYCQEKLRKSGSSFTLALYLLPKAKKAALTALYAFCREVDDVVDEISEPFVARHKLDFWFAEIDRLFESTPQHPITKALLPHIPLYQWEKKYFTDILLGMELDLQYQGYQCFEDLQLYCYRVAGAVGILSAHVFGLTTATKTAVMDFAKNLGTALQLVNIIRDLGEDLRRNRNYLPEDDLQKFNIQPEDLFKRSVNIEDFQSLLHFQAQRARSYYAQALAALPQTMRANQRPALMMANTYFALLDVIESENFDVLNQKISLPPSRKIIIAVKTLWQEKFNPFSS